LVENNDIKASLSADDVIGEEDEPAMDWDIIHAL
jgi:hypothetical protein